MSSLDEKEMLAQDQGDVLEILRMRFRDVPDEIVEKITSIQQLEVLQRLILVAANATNWTIFLEELQENESSFRLLGERFDPIDHNARREGDMDGEKS
ncbi:MAG: hypothetical protein WD469_03330 [Paenibacillaceae bacterium]